ncbi:MAG TPA: SDR family oxidoreductase [Sedimentisphaerales bacterium]|nr:SDR family oxidoreductase [Sedimentisphaerales bacterium]
MELSDKTAVVNGASGRLGGAVAEALGKAGCNCICHYNRNKEKAENIVEQIKQMGVKALAKELAHAICVNSIAPGVVTWPGDFDESEKQRQLSFIPARRIATISDVTAAVIYLLKNDYITGQVLCVDGGRCM